MSGRAAPSLPLAVWAALAVAVQPAAPRWSPPSSAAPWAAAAVVVLGAAPALAARAGSAGQQFERVRARVALAQLVGRRTEAGGPIRPPDIRGLRGLDGAAPAR